MPNTETLKQGVPAADSKAAPPVRSLPTNTESLNQGAPDADSKAGLRPRSMSTNTESLNQAAPDAVSKAAPRLRSAPTNTETLQQGVLADLMSDDTFRPAEPRSLAETRLSATVIEDLVCKFLLAIGSASGREIASNV